MINETNTRKIEIKTYIIPILIITITFLVVGTLIINDFYRMKKEYYQFAEQLLNYVTVFGIIALVVVYISLIYIIIMNYKKNKHLFAIAFFDILTGLPNLQFMKQYVAKEIANNKQGKKALLLINCSDFKAMNMVYGFDLSDEVIKGLSKKINELKDDNHKPFRFSGDRFGLYVKNYYTKENLISLAEKIYSLFSEPFKNKDAEQYYDLRVGIVEVNATDNVDRIFMDALVALNNVTNDSIYAFFNEEMEQRINRQDMIEREIRNIINDNNASNKLYLEYQPLADIKTNKIVGFEALARLKTDSFGNISPVEFISIAEKKQLIVPLGNMILRMACNYVKTLRQFGYKDVRVAVNVSGIQLLRNDFIDTVLKITRETGIDESNLEIEITESILLDNYEMINRKLKRLREHNIKIALDDFGTGYSSFARLRDLNIDVVKIDRYFIRRLSLEDSKNIMTGAIISMAHMLGLQVVAEGVEEEVQREYLLNNNCDIIQGYLFGKPLPQDEALKYLN